MSVHMSVHMYRFVHECHGVPDCDVDVRIDMCIGMCINVSIDMCMDMCINVSIDMCIDMCINVSIYMCIDAGADMCYPCGTAPLEALIKMLHTPASHVCIHAVGDGRCPTGRAGTLWHARRCR